MEHFFQVCGRLSIAQWPSLTRFRPDFGFDTQLEFGLMRTQIAKPDFAAGEPAAAAAVHRDGALRPLPADGAVPAAAVSAQRRLGRNPCQGAAGGAAV